LIAINRRMRSRDGDEGFTLIELMVVVLIIAILIAIAIPTFLGARERAQERAAQSNLRNALTSAKVVYVDNQSYLVTDVAGTDAALTAVEPSLGFDGVAAIDGLPASEVSFAATATQVTFAGHSANGKCFYIRDLTVNPGAGTTYAHGVAATCDAAVPAFVGGAAFNADSNVGW